MAASSEHPHATANQPASAGAAEQPWVEIYGSRGFPQWLAGQRTSLAFSTYQTGKLFLIGTTPDRTLSIFERTFNRAMGMCGDGEGFWLGTKYQLWRFENALAAGDVHQELGTISPRNSFQPLWHPPFISRLLPEDRCHLNGLALRDGRARYVTAVSQSDVADGWRARRRDGGVVIDVVTNEIVCEGLSMPHSPRWYRDELWVLNSGRGEIGKVNLKRRRFEPLAFCPGYLRGLTFVGDHAVVTLSQPRHDKTFNGLELDDELAKRDATAQCGLQVVDLRSGEISHWVKVEHQVTEIYDVVALPGAIRPMSLGLKTDEIERLLVLDPPGIL